MLEIRLIQIHFVLGKEDFLRVLIDLLASKNPRTLLHTANPVIFLRSLFDPYFNSRYPYFISSKIYIKKIENLLFKIFK
jgi:hypothetical protein